MRTKNSLLVLLSCKSDLIIVQKIFNGIFLIKGIDKATLKLNRQRWRFYRRAQQANKLRTSRPRYFSLNILIDKLNKLNTKSSDSEYSPKHQNPGKIRQEFVDKKLGLCLSNLELKNRQLKDKYETHATPLAASNYLLNQKFQHTCLIKKKSRSFSTSCINCFSDSNVLKSKNAKRNSLFTTIPKSELAKLDKLSPFIAQIQQNTKLSANLIPLKSELTHIEELLSDQDSNIEKQTNKIDISDINSKTQLKKKLRKRVHDLKKNPRKLEDSSLKPVNKTETFCSCLISVFNSDTSSNETHKEKIGSSPLSRNASNRPNKNSSADYSLSLSSNCSTPFPVKKQNKQSSILESSSLSSHNIDRSPTSHPSNVMLRPPPPPPPPSIISLPATSLLNDQVQSKFVNTFDEDDEEEFIYSLSKLDNPFLLFICFSIFIEHRDHIMQTQMDANDIACYFDKMARKHNMKTIIKRSSERTYIIQKYIYRKQTPLIIYSS